MAVVNTPQIVKAPTFNNVDWGKTATMDFRLDNSRVHRLFLNISGAQEGTPLGLSDIVRQYQLKIGGRAVRIGTPAELAAMISLNWAGAFGQITNGGIDTPAKNTFLQIPFKEDWRRTEAEAMALAWGLGGLGQRGIQVTLELELNPKPHASAIISKFEALMELDYPVDANGNALGIGSIMKCYRETIPSQSVGQYTWQTLPRIDRLHRLHFFSSRISEMEVFANNTPIYRATKAQNNALLRMKGFNPQPNVFHVVLDRDQLLAQDVDLPNLGQLRFDIHHDTAGSPYEVIYEVLGTPG